MWILLFVNRYFLMEYLVLELVKDVLLGIIIKNIVPIQIVAVITVD